MQMTDKMQEYGSSFGYLPLIVFL